MMCEAVFPATEYNAHSNVSVLMCRVIPERLYGTREDIGDYGTQQDKQYKPKKPPDASTKDHTISKTNANGKQKNKMGHLD